MKPKWSIEKVFIERWQNYRNFYFTNIGEDIDRFQKWANIFLSMFLCISQTFISHFQIYISQAKYFSFLPLASILSTVHSFPVSKMLRK
jgi:hypothetical protein